MRHVRSFSNTVTFILERPIMFFKYCRIAANMECFSSFFIAHKCDAFQFVFSFLFSWVPLRNFPPINSIQKRAGLRLLRQQWQRKKDNTWFKECHQNGKLINHTWITWPPLRFLLDCITLFTSLIHQFLGKKFLMILKRLLMHE